MSRNPAERTYIAAPRLRRGRAIVADIAATTGTCARDLCADARFFHIVAARRLAWRRMLAAGLTLAEAGLVTGHHRTTVMYSLGMLSKAPGKLTPRSAHVA